MVRDELPPVTLPKSGKIYVKKIKVNAYASVIVEE